MKSVTHIFIVYEESEKAVRIGAGIWLPKSQIVLGEVFQRWQANRREMRFGYARDVIKDGQKVVDERRYQALTVPVWLLTSKGFSKEFVDGMIAEQSRPGWKLVFHDPALTPCGTSVLDEPRPFPR